MTRVVPVQTDVDAAALYERGVSLHDLGDHTLEEIAEHSLQEPGVH